MTKNFYVINFIILIKIKINCQARNNDNKLQEFINNKWLWIIVRSDNASQSILSLI